MSRTELTMRRVVPRRDFALCTTVKAAYTVDTAQPDASNLIAVHITQRFAVQYMRQIRLWVTVHRSSVRGAVHSCRPGHMACRIAKNDGQQRRVGRHGLQKGRDRSVEAQERMQGIVYAEGPNLAF